MRRDLPWEKWAAMTICLAAAVFAVVFFARTLLLCLLPFLLAHLLSLAVIPLARKLSYKTKLPEKGAAVVLFFLLLAAVILPLGFGLARLLREAQDLLARLPALIADPDAFFQGLPDRLLPAKIRESEGYGAMREAIGGMIAGLGGLYFVMDSTGGGWTNDGFGDKGWLAIAIVIFATWKPMAAILGSYLFGALYILYNYMNVPMQTIPIMQMLPYIVTIVVLVIVSVRKKRENQPPASLGLSYFREER